MNASARKPEDTARLERLLPLLDARHGLLQAVRAFFVGRGFTEVDTPVRVRAPANEEYIDAEPSGAWFLRASPELHMKRLLAAGARRLFQLGPCFRQGERGARHLPEFTMLEWYRADADYHDILDDARALVRAAAVAVNGTPRGRRDGRVLDLGGEWECVTLDALFAQWGGCSVEAALAEGSFEQRLVERIEPRLGFPRPTVVFDYPAAQGALARPKPDCPARVERWELYIGGLEIANTYSELTDAAEQERRFRAAAELRTSQNRSAYPLDEHFLAALRAGLLPRCAGSALGFDRLLMILTGAATIAEVVAFPPEC